MIRQQNKENETSLELVEYFTRRPKCARCEYLKTFGCEHKTPVRDYMVVKYLDEGKYYMESKAQSAQVSPQIKRLKYAESNIRKSNDSQFDLSYDRSNQCARCKQMNAFICEHDTRVRDTIFDKYNEEGRFYTPVTPKPKLNYMIQSTVKTKNNLKSKSMKTINSHEEDEDDKDEKNFNESTRISFLNEKSTSNLTSNETKKLPVNIETIKKSENDNKKPVIESKHQKSEEPNKKSGGCCSVM